MNHLTTNILSFFLLLSIYGCNLDIPTENQLTDPNAITSVRSAYEALSTAYATYPRAHFLLSLMADDYAPLSYARMTPNLLNTYQWQPFELEKQADLLWQEYYHCIVNLNAVLTRLDDLRTKVEDTEQPNVDRIQAEAETLKALCYLELLQIFATRYEDSRTEGILLKDHVEAEQLPRSSKQDCIKEIKRLLDSSHRLFHRTEGLIPPHEDHPSFVSSRANALALARLSLYIGDYPTATDYAEEVLHTYPITQMEDNTRDILWSNSSKEQVILVLSNSEAFYTETFVSGRKISDFTYMMNPDIAVGSDDIRRSSYVIDSIPPTGIPGGQTVLPLLGKFNRPNLQHQEIRQIPIMRPVEALFICAEAEARVGKTADARRHLNEYLEVVHADPIPMTTDGTALIARIVHEKHKEFSGENIRYFDLKRLDIPREILGFDGRHQDISIPKDDYRWTLPIPKSEYRTNFSIVKQNAGWPEFKRIRTE